MPKKALIAMSGGVDSSVCAYLMKENGFDCTGITMKLYNNEDIVVDCGKTCCSLKDVEDARSVAFRLNIPYYVLNFTDDFKEQVIKRFVESYENGFTPNPCIDCNRYIKFEKLFVRAKQLLQDYVVTGHYANIEYDEKSKRYLLKKAIDETKDQSYVLYSMTQDQLAHTIFPLGKLRKTHVREIAQKAGFINAKKHDSQDICFVPNGNYAEFIENYTGKSYEAGNFVDKNGNLLGRHNGIIRYTIGQRKGLGISCEFPLFVVDKDLKNNNVILGKSEELYTKSLTAGSINLISCEKLDSPVRLKAKIRYRQEEQWALAEQLDENHIRVEFEQPQRAVTKGQAVVLYDGDIVVGGGIIE